MIDSDPEENQQPHNALHRVVEAARRGQARLSAYRRQETAALATWLRSHLLRQGSKGRQTKVGRSLRRAVTARRLRQRQEVHRNGGPYPSTAVHALQRAARAVDANKKN